MSSSAMPLGSSDRLNSQCFPPGAWVALDHALDLVCSRMSHA